jgi:hypothetical protein
MNRIQTDLSSHAVMPSHTILRLSPHAISLSYTLALYLGCTFNEVNGLVHTIIEEFISYSFSPVFPLMLTLPEFVTSSVRGLFAGLNRPF